MRVMTPFLIKMHYNIHPALWRKKGSCNMIEITKLNGAKMLVNTSLIETVEETPDTVITLTSGKKIIVKESRQDVKNLVKLARKEIFASDKEDN